MWGEASWLTPLGPGHALSLPCLCSGGLTPRDCSTWSQTLQLRLCFSRGRTQGGRRWERVAVVLLACPPAGVPLHSSSVPAAPATQPPPPGLWLSLDSHLHTTAASAGYLLTGLLTLCHPSGTMFLQREDLVCLRHCREHPASVLVHSRGSACFVD